MYLRRRITNSKGFNTGKVFYKLTKYLNKPCTSVNLTTPYKKKSDENILFETICQSKIQKRVDKNLI
jgi:hypothetical protein